MASRVVVSGHQPNTLPGMSVMEKMRVADLFIWCDRFQGIRHGWFNRNRLSDGTPLVVPMDHRDWSAAIGDIAIGNDARWRRKFSKTLEFRFHDRGIPYAEIVNRPYGKVIGVNAALLRQLCIDLDIRTETLWQSHLTAGGGNPLRAHVDNTEVMKPVSRRIAEMVEEVGGTVWLSGPSGRKYLDHEPFAERGIAVEYFDYEGPNPSAIEWLAK